MRDAADVGGDDDVRLQLAQVAELAVTQLVAQVGVEHRVGAGRAAAQVRLAARHLDLEPERGQVLLHRAAQLLAVLQAAGRMKRQMPARARVAGRRPRNPLRPALAQCRHDGGQQLAQVPGQFADALGLGGVGGFVLEEMPVLAHRDAASGGVHDEGFDLAGGDHRPPGVDVGAHFRAPAILIVEVKLHRAAAARLGRDHGLDAGSVQHAGGGGVDVGHH